MENKKKQKKMNVEEIEPTEKAFRMGLFGMWLLIMSLSVLFAATLLGLTVAYINPNNPRGADGSDFPMGFFISTLIILISTLTISKSVKAIKTRAVRQIESGLVQTLGLAYVFLFVQFANWIQLYRLQITPYSQDMYAFSIYILTILHALHVLGGLVPLTQLVSRAKSGDFGMSFYNAVRYTATYWHFLSIVWYVVVVVLWFM